MTTYKPSDRVTVTRPQQPTHHQGGETGTVRDSRQTDDGQLVRIEERGGGISVCWPTNSPTTADQPASHTRNR